MFKAVAYKGSKTMEPRKVVAVAYKVYKKCSSGAHQFDGMLVVVYENFQLQGFDRENFGFGFVDAYGRRLLTRGGRRWSFDCIRKPP